MTVDESPVSPPSAAQTASKLAQKKLQQEQVSSQLAEGHPVLQQRSPGQQQNQVPQPDQPISFENFQELHQATAESKLNQLAEVTGCQDRGLLIRAFNETRVGNYEFNVASAIDWVLKFTETVAPVEQTRRPNRESNMSPAVVSHTPVSAISAHSTAPPNSPNASSKPIVDLTESSPNKENIDVDLEKAIKLSLEEANRNSVAFGGGGISQEEQDVSRALEASLMETQLGGGKRKRNENWSDPLNPHDRERDGLWPVGLKNVGQTCWFSAVIQSLFYLPAFRSLVFNYRSPPTYIIDITAGEEDSNKKATQSAFDERQRKIIEFMQELRRLFALMVSSQRKYVDPSRAVDILRGSIGSGNGSGGPTGSNNGQGSVTTVCLNDNDQQDVSEFTHIVLEWVEEAFKDANSSTSTFKSLTSEMMDEGSNDQGEKENSEEKEHKEIKNNLAPSNSHGIGNDDNPMAKLFYGKVQTEGSIKGEPFLRVEAFGQWPLQVNSFTHIHDSLENSTAHEYFNVSTTSGGADDSGQERWFTQLPPILFLELSRFQYNMERRIAEKIHNRLEFPEIIYMDRYMTSNKNITRSKREEVRALKERRRLLKERLKKFTHYGLEEVRTENEPDSASKNRLPLPEVLQHTLNFALSGCASAIAIETQTPLPAVPSLDRTSSPAVSKSVEAVKMQVDSPCHSPKMTPASSVANLATASSFGLDTDVCPMEVEGWDENRDEMGVATLQTPFNTFEGCDIKSTENVGPSLEVKSDEIIVAADPSPRSISESEMKILQSCLTRWKQEVEDDMKTLESSIKLVEQAIEDMYDSVEELRKLEFRLHAVMVHEGSIDSGHYWAYVRDHKRKVWLKFNDNTVSEVTWDELLRESVGGHSNASAYSLVYIDASKPELLMDSELNTSDEGDSEERMDEGTDPDSLLKLLPQDLIDYVSQDNQLFRKEMIDWDKDQLAKQQAALEAAAAAKLQKQQQTDEMSVSDPNNDLEIVKEKLNYNNNHARLSADVSIKVIRQYEGSNLNSNSPIMKSASDQVIQHYLGRISKTPDLVNEASSQSSSKSAMSDVAPMDIRLESFVLYLLKNNVNPKSQLMQMAVLEQLAYPGIDQNDKTQTKFREYAEYTLSLMQKKHKEEVAELREWHQTYHWYRRSAHNLVNGMEAFYNHKFDKALGCFTEAYYYNDRARSSKPVGPLKSLRPRMLIKFLCLTLPEVNNSLIKQFSLGEGLQEVVHAVQQLVVPCLTILQSRINENKLHSGTIEGIRNDWCTLLALADTKAEASTALESILALILDSEGSPENPVRLSKNGEFVNLNADIKLAQKYREMVTKLQELEERG